MTAVEADHIAADTDDAVGITTHRPVFAAVVCVALATGPIAACTALLLLWERVAHVDVDVTAIVVLLVIVRQVATFSASAHYHRSLSHRHFEFHPVVERPLRVWNFLFMGSGRAWAVMHRLHHKETDGALDPHSPHKPGESLATIFQQTSAGYFDVARRLQRRDPSLAKYDVALPDDAFERFAVWVSSKGFIGIMLARAPIGIAFLSLFFGVPVAALVFLTMMASMWTGTILIINGITHLWGYRTTPSHPDRSTNVLPVDVIGFGELMHHNHHVSPGRSNLAVAPFELDLGFHALVLLEKVGVVRNLNRAGNV